MPICAHSENCIQTGTRFDQQPHVGRIILTIGIHGDDQFATRSPESRLEGGALSTVGDQIEDPQGRLSFLVPSQQRFGAIGGTIVDDDHLLPATQLLVSTQFTETGEDFLEQWTQCFLFVVCRNHH